MVTLIDIKISQIEEDTSISYILDVLQDIKSIPSNFHNLLPLSLGYAILRLPEEKRLAAQGYWLPLAKFHNPPASQLLWYFIRAIEIESDIAKAPYLAIMNGIPVSTTLRHFRFKETERKRVETSILDIHNRSHNEIEAGGDINEVAQRYIDELRESTNRLYWWRPWWRSWWF